MQRNQVNTWAKWLRRAGLGLVVAAGFAAVAHASGGHGEHGGSLDINWWGYNPHQPPMGWFLLDFAIFLGGLIFFAAKPMAQAFAQRHLSIKRAISEAASAHAKATTKQHDWRDKLAKVESEVKALTEASKRDGAEEREQIVREAKSYTERMLRDSASMASQEVQRAQERLRRRLLTQALNRAEELLEQQLTDDDRHRLLEQAIVELENGDGLGDSTARGKGGLRLVTGGAA